MAQDPSVRINGLQGSILMAKISVPAEDLIAGPMGYRLHLIDYDATTRQFNGAHEIPPSFEDEPPAWRAGDPRIVGDYRFHAQNVYALVMKTLARFEFALGRRVGWSFRTHQLKVAPHGMLDANAFYSPREEGLFSGTSPAGRARRFTPAFPTTSWFMKPPTHCSMRSVSAISTRPVPIRPLFTKALPMLSRFCQFSRNASWSRNFFVQPTQTSLRQS